jgi:CheY-like chemotaxis protein
MALILIVDDESKMRHILKIMLSLEGHNVEGAQDGEKALAMVRERPYDLVISDIQMPGMDGLALLDHIQAMEVPWL